MTLEEKIENLKTFLKDKKTILGFSAGSDSTLLAYILSEVSPESLLVTIDNNMMPREFINYTKQQAQKIGLKHKIIKLNFLEESTFINNRKERCYECRKQMYANIQKLPEFGQYQLFIEGTNITDLLENRPGVLVKNIYNMTSPLVECDITKKEVYDMIKYFNLEYSHDTTCLATRIKTNQKVNKEKLKLTNDAEDIIKKYVQQDNIRVRYDDQTAIIAIDNPLEILDKNLLSKIRNKLQKLGYKKVFLDITGYEKTKLEASIDSNGNYYYQLPYTINLEKTKNNINKQEKLTKTVTLNKNLTYDDVTIEKNGKISMPPTDDFINKFNTILGSVERKEI